MQLIKDRVTDMRRDYKMIAENFHMDNETVNLGAYSAIKAAKNYNISYEPKDFEIDSF